MATVVGFKRYICSDRKAVLQKVYDYLIAGDANWEVIHEEGGYSAGTPADQDYFVIQAKAAWSDGSGYKQQLLLCARDNTTGSATFGGSAGGKWTISDDSFSFVYAADGGWNATSKDFADIPTALPEKQVDYDVTNTSAPGFDMSLVTTTSAFVLFGFETSGLIALFAGEVDVTDTDAEDPRPCAFFWGILSLTAATTYGWASTTSAGYCPSLARDAWNQAATDCNGLRIDTYGQQKNSGAWNLWPLPIFSISPARTVGTFGFIKRVSTSLTNGDEMDDHSKIVFAGVVFPWSAP